MSLRAVTTLGALLAFAGLGPAGTALAQVDQDFSLPSASASAWLTVGINQPLGQGFTPSAAVNSGIALCLRIENAWAAPAPITLLLHDATITGPVLATASLLPTLPLSLPTPCEWRSFTYAGGPVLLTPGQPYVIEADSTSPYFSWYGTDAGYAGGPSVIAGTVTTTGHDFFFRTYTSTVLAVEFERAAASRLLDGSVEVAWSTLAESDTHVFVVERSPRQAGPFAAIGAVDAHGPLRPYTLLDPVPGNGPVWYRVREHTSAGPGVTSAAFAATAAAAGDGAAAGSLADGRAARSRVRLPRSR